MISLLVDANIQGHANIIEMQIKNSDWLEYAEFAELHFLFFDDVGLAPDAPDDLIWRLCQQEGYWLLTDNRNKESEDSLQATLLREGTSTSTPVITISSSKRLLKNRTYLDSVIAKLIEYALNAEQYLGAGRLYIP